VKSMSSMGLLTIQPVSFETWLQLFLEIFFEALEKKHYKCFLGPKTDLPMIYIDDCIQGTVRD
jgi:hypothetical protein